MCYKIINGEVSLHCNLLDLSDFTQTRGHKYKLYKHQSNVNAYKYFFCNCICDTWNALPCGSVTINFAYLFCLSFLSASLYFSKRRAY